MSQSDKAHFYRELKARGATFTKHYREYSTDELQAAYAKMVEEQGERPPDPPPPSPDIMLPQGAVQPPADPGQPRPTQPPARQQLGPQIPRRAANPDEMAGQRQNTQPEDEPLRVDEQGRIWYQEEVRKPAFAKPRGRRVLQYMERGVETRTVQDGKFVETFEIAGQGAGRPAEVKITLPSYQVGIFKDPRLPFRIHVYNGMQGFDLFEVERYYGGRELVPAECKRIYVENVLCYDIRTVVRAIQDEYRQLRLLGKVD